MRILPRCRAELKQKLLSTFIPSRKIKVCRKVKAFFFVYTQRIPKSEQHTRECACLQKGKRNFLPKYPFELPSSKANLVRHPEKGAKMELLNGTKTKKI